MASTPRSDRGLIALGNSDLNRGNIMLTGAIGSRTPSTELYVPPSHHHGTSPGASRQLQRDEVSSAPPMASAGPHVAEGASVMEKDSLKHGKEAWHHTKPTLCGAERSRKRMKRAALLAATEDAALGLAVAASEGVVVAAVMENCFSAHKLVPGLTLEATVQLRRARQSIGLDKFCFRTDNCGSREDEEWITCLDDAAMHEDYLDVGLSLIVGHAGSENRPKYGLHNDDRRSLGKPVTKVLVTTPRRSGVKSPQRSPPACSPVHKLSGAAHTNRDEMVASPVNDDAGGSAAVNASKGNTSVALGRQAHQREARPSQEQKHQSSILLKVGKRTSDMRLEYSNLTDSGDMERGESYSGHHRPRSPCNLHFGGLAENGGGTKGHALLEMMDFNARPHIPPTQNSVTSSSPCSNKTKCYNLPRWAAEPAVCAYDPFNPTYLSDALDGWLGDRKISVGVGYDLHSPTMCTETNLLYGVKQTPCSSFQGFRTTSEPLGLLLHALDITCWKSATSTLLRDGAAQPAIGDNMGCSVEVENSMDDPDLAESPPLLWPCRKRSRLQARVVDSQSTHGLTEEPVQLNLLVSSKNLSQARTCLWPRCRISRCQASGVMESQSTHILTERPLHKGFEKPNLSGNSKSTESPTVLWPCSKKSRLSSRRDVDNQIADSLEDKPLDSDHANNSTEYPMVTKVDIGSETYHLDCLKRPLSAVALDAAAHAMCTDFLPPKIPATGGETTLKTYYRRSKWQRPKYQCSNAKPLYSIEAEVGGLSPAQELFRGVQFLITGFKKTQKIDLVTSIEKHGGTVLLDVPPPSVLQANLLRRKACVTKGLPIVIASSQVRTSKFLYACAIGSPPLKPTWISSSIKMNRCLPYAKYEHLPSSKQARQGGLQPIFEGVRALLHGQSTFRARLSVLIEHGGGRVLKSMRSIKQELAVVANKSAVVIAENCDGFLSKYKRFALRFNLHIVPVEWLVQSLLSQRLLPLPASEDVPTLVNLQKTAARLSPELDPLRHIFVVRKKRSKLFGDRVLKQRESIPDQQPRDTFR